ncbi:MAG: S41 family peptidase [Candidatus Azobacteroides sp.]|nr:S41 family peptidase [Candidatus Azobacteroides sp.]
MKQIFTDLKIKIAGLIIAGTFISFSGQAQLSEKAHFDIAKYLDIYNALFKELNMFYVDSIDVKKTVQDNITFMLRRLDPYTEFIPEEDMSKFEVQTTGEYGGIGALIGSGTGNITITEPYEGMPAALAGLQAGDVLLEIDGVDLTGKDASYASEHLKGQPNTKVKIKFRRVGEDKPREIVVERKRLQINPVIYYGVLPGNIGYIYLSDFTTHSASSVKEAFDDLKTNKGIEALIIDVRDNGGGVVEDCLEILNYFLPKGELLLTMKGKFRQLDRTFRATQQPIAPDIPLAILVNRMSASASEILAGTLQDLDRAVIIGTRTFGKGLVQSPRPLPYDGSLKVTTAKYYIPSGRNIQAIDYSHRNEDGSISSIPDSLTSVFHTSKGRSVRDGGGITPDFVTEEKKVPTIVYYMESDNLFFDFVTSWRTKHPQIAPPEQFVLSDEDYEAFKAFVRSKDFNYDRQSEKALDTLKEIMTFEGYFASASEEFTALENKLKPDLNRDLDLHKDILSDRLAGEIMKQYYYAKGEKIYSLRDDSDLKKAIEVLSDKNTYANTFSAQ